MLLRAGIHRPRCVVLSGCDPVVPDRADGAAHQLGLLGRPSEVHEEHVLHDVAVVRVTLPAHGCLVSWRGGSGWMGKGSEGEVGVGWGAGGLSSLPWVYFHAMCA